MAKRKSKTNNYLNKPLSLPWDPKLIHRQLKEAAGILVSQTDDKNCSNCYYLGNDEMCQSKTSY